MANKKYDTAFKMKVINSVLKYGLNQNQTAIEFNVHSSDVQKWLDAYEHHGLEGIERKKVKTYSGEFKQFIIEDMHENGLSMRTAAAKYNLPNHNSLSKWERIYLKEGPEGLYKERRGLSPGRPRKIKVEEDLISENQRLRMELDYLKKLSALVQQNQHLNKRHK